MNYIRVDNNKAAEIIPEFNPVFPDIPIEERYEKDFVAKLIPDETETVQVGWIYDPETGEFTAPLPPVPVPQNIDEAKEIKITESKVKLREWLRDNPITWTDGKKYSVTEEKQTLLNSNLASYERAKAAGAEYSLRWNATGEECVPWEYEELVALSLAIAEYVAPKVSKQQEIELAIKACETSEELESIVISYD